MKAGLWKTDWFLGAVVVLVVLVFNRSRDLIPSLEQKAYDLGVQSTSRPPSDKVAVIAIDDTSIANIGRWPWSREIHARMTDLLAGAKTKVIANTVFFSEPQIDPGYVYITKLLELATPTPEMAPIVTLLKEAEQTLNTDRRLAESYVKAGNVLLPVFFRIDIPRGRPDRPLPEYFLKNAIPAKIGDDFGALATSEAQMPIELIGRSAAALGHLSARPDVDGGVRTEPLVLRYFDHHFPSLSLMIAAKSLNLGPSDIKIQPDSVSLGRLRIGTDPQLKMYTYFYRDRDDRAAFPVDSFYDVYSGKIPPTKYTDKIVLIGATAAGIGTYQVTPVSAATPPAVALAHAVSSILQEHFFVVPPWAPAAELLIIALVAAYLIVLLPRLGAGPALAISGGVFAGLLVLHFALMRSAGIWMQLMLPATLLLIGHAALVSKRFIVTERAKLKSDETSAESSRMLGLAYQGQGQLDLAWDKFRQVPLSEALLDNLYNLALDFERKRQFNKAEGFFREAETAGRLSHPNIVTIYDTGEEHDFCYIAMELLKGGDLAPYTKAGNLLPVDQVVSITARVADALGYAHRQGVVHRDIKPANMMYHRESDTLKVTDFGIARLTDSSRTKTGMVLGTPSYMSPEQLAGKRIEGRSDLFSLGVTLYQLLCGRLPFEGESMAQLMFKIANDPPTDMRTISPELAPPLVAFVERALGKNPDERFQTGEEFGGALRATLSATVTREVDIPL